MCILISMLAPPSPLRLTLGALTGALPLTYTRTRLETRLPSGTKLLRPRGIGRRRRLPQCQAPPPSHFTSCLLLQCALGDLCCYPLTLIHASCLRRLAGPHVPCMATAGTPKVSPVDLQMACARETRVETSQCRGAQHVLQHVGLSQSGFHSRAFTVGLSQSGFSRALGGQGGKGRRVALLWWARIGRCGCHSHPLVFIASWIRSPMTL